MASEAVAAINGLTGATEAATALTKVASGPEEMIAKSLSILVNTILQPLMPIFLYIMQQLVLAWTNFKAWWDGLIGWIDEKVIKPIAEWIDKYIVQPFWAFYNNVMKWIDTYIVQPFWKFYNDVMKWIDTYIVKPFWKFFSEVTKWIDDNIVKPFLKFFTDVSKWVEVNLVKPFWEFISGVTAWVEENLVAPFWKFFEDVTKWVDTNISAPFFQFFTDISKWITDYIVTPFEAFFTGLEALFYNLLASIVNTLLSIPVVGEALAALGLSSMPVQQFEKGGVVPGKGPQLAVVHGGETIIPEGKTGSNTFNFYGYQDDVFIKKVKDIIRAQGTRYNL